MEKDLHLKSEINEIRKVEKVIDEVIEQNRFPEEIFGNVLIPAVEAVNNSIVHGNREDPSKCVWFNLKLKNNELNIYIEDEGEGFDYENLPDPTAPQNIEKITGRGIFLMHKLSDEVTYIKGGKAVKLSFKLSQNQSNPV